MVTKQSRTTNENGKQTKNLCFDVKSPDILPTHTSVAHNDSILGECARNNLSNK